MKILVACEESQRVTEAFRKRGHEAFSCDILKESGGFPQWHTRQNVLNILNGNCSFETEDGALHTVAGRWDMIIAFPPCTHLAVSGAAWFHKKRESGEQENAVRFFCRMLSAECDKIAVENPVNIIAGEYVKQWFPVLASLYGLPLKPSQIIQPYYFGDHARKKKKPVFG